ncbi:polyribonucleotide nucleotidyltransferase [Mycoplasmatota bacterium]|nr:polyribonucleotide nucleotidyltransferase [Mycoplasmatota bacterium]
MSKKVFEYQLAGRTLTVEYGEVAKQADCGLLVRFDDTVVLSVAQASKKATTLDFFPLMVMYNEKMYAAGKIPGGFFKREGRPSTHETLTSRVIDRTLRPLFTDGFRNEVQIINTVLCSNPDNTPEMTALFGSSLALTISDIPFEGPVAGVIVGRVDGEFIINPTEEQLEQSDIDLTVSGTYEAINMVEAGAKQVSEEDMLDAILFGHEEIKRLTKFIEEIRNEVGKEKRIIEVFQVDEETADKVVKIAEDRIIEAVKIQEKHARSDAIDEIKSEVIESFTTENVEESILKSVKKTLDKIVKSEVRRLITIDKIRPDGRKTDEIRPLDSQIDILPRTHGSALFTRGQTQCLSVATLGALGEHQIIDGLSESETYKRFMLHYNFPLYSVGETGRYGGAGRREIGHGMLGERAISMVMPDEEKFPYTVRIVSEILESNGSTSQASICAGTMSLMAAGVPIEAPVAGIAMGLISDGENYTILSDIQGMEDHLGDMDFKVAGTAKGITALQMDIKISGLSKEILKEALMQAKVGRAQILKNMTDCIENPRSEVSEFAPKVMITSINPDKIRDVIGPGGKMITEIIEKSDGVKIDIEQDGKVIIMHHSLEPIKNALKLIEDIVREVEIGKKYLGKVVRVEKFGCFIELWPGMEGLCHISKLDHKRVDKVEDVVKVGDRITIKAIQFDDRGRLDLSRKATLPRPEKNGKAQKESATKEENK